MKRFRLHLLILYILYSYSMPKLMRTGVDADLVYRSYLHTMAYRGVLHPDTAPYVAPGANARALKEIADDYETERQLRGSADISSNGDGIDESPLQRLLVGGVGAGGGGRCGDRAATPYLSRRRRRPEQVLHDVAEAQEIAVLACNLLENDPHFARDFLRTGRLHLVRRHVVPAFLLGVLLAFLGFSILFWMLIGAGVLIFVGYYEYYE